MRGRDGSFVSVVWACVLSLGFALISCGGSGDAERARDAAERALAEAELWDPQAGDTVADAVRSEPLTVAAFESYAAADPNRAAHLRIAADMGYEAVLAAGRVTYDNGAVVTSAALGGGSADEVALLVVGAMPGADEAPESVFIAEPVYEDGRLIRIDFTGEKGDLSLDASTGEIELSDPRYSSCWVWNCLAGAVYFWWEDNSDAMDAYWGTAGEVCFDCLLIPLSQPVTCPLCAAFIGAPIVASLAECSLWPCDLCVSDDCHSVEYEGQHCVTENGVGSVRSSVTPWHCENPKTQESECVRGETTETVIESCPWGCRPGSPTCQFAAQCMVGGYCAPIESEPFCVGSEVWTPYQNAVCEASDDPAAGGKWGTCQPAPYLGSGHWTTTCPYACADGACQPPPTCDATVCEQIEEPLGDPVCLVRPDDGKSVIVQEIRPHGCVTVQPQTAVPADWPEGRSCEPLDPTLRVLETCPAECSADGLACAETCDPSACSGEIAGDTSCAYDYRRYKLYQSFENRECRPQPGGGSACETSSGETREIGLCPWGCTADGAECAPDEGLPEAPGEFLVLEGPSGRTEFSWTDNSLDEQGYRIYHGGCSAVPARPCTVIGTADADQMQVTLDWERPDGGDRCWEVRAFNATGESAPAWYCLPD